MFLPLLEINLSSTGLLAIALIIIMGYVSSAIFKRTRVPELLILMLIGIFSVQIANLVPINYLDGLRAIAPIFGSLALVVIMLNASKELKFDNSIIKNWKGIGLGVLDCILAMILLSAFMYYLFGWPPIYGAILGIILGETSTVVVIPFIREVKINQDIFGALFAETTINSIVAIAIFSLLLILVNQSISAFSFATYLLDYISLALVIGLVAGIGWVFVLNTLKGAREYTATLAVAILLYGFVDLFNGAAIITVLIFGMIVGNEKIVVDALKLNAKDKNDVNKQHNENGTSEETNEKAVEKELEFLIRTFFFVFMGMITVLSAQYLLYGLAVSVILILARYAEIRALFYNNTAEERKLAFALMPRGVTVATLATIAYGIGGSYFTQTFYISFIVIVITSIAASLMLNRVAVEVKK